MINVEGESECVISHKHLARHQTHVSPPLPTAAPQLEGPIFMQNITSIKYLLNYNKRW
jgi:hypothetical protein